MLAVQPRNFLSQKASQAPTRYIYTDTAQFLYAGLHSELPTGETSLLTLNTKISHLLRCLIGSRCSPPTDGPIEASATSTCCISWYGWPTVGCLGLEANRERKHIMLVTKP